MSQPYHLAYINLALFLFLMFGFFFYRHIYPRRKIPLLVILIITSCLPIISIWRQGVPESGDFALHVKILMSFYGALEKGIIIPRWAAEFCGGYGVPVFEYFYKAPFYAASAFHFFGLSFISSMKLLFSLVFVLSGVTMYFWLKDEFGEKPAFLGSIFYLFAPYQLAGLHFRHAIGEGFGFMLVPLIFLLARKIIKSRRSKFWLLLTTSYGLLILSHHIVPVLVTPLIFLYASTQTLLLKKNRMYAFFYFFSAFVFAILLTAFHWVPILLGGGLLQQSQMTSITFHPFVDFIYSRWRYGFLFQGHYGEVSPIVGYVHLLLLPLSILLLINKKLPRQERVQLVLFMSFFFVSLAMMQTFTQSLWQTIPLLNTFQFSTRLLFIITLACAPLAAICVKNLRLIFQVNKNKVDYVVILVAIITIAYTLLNWGNRGMIRDVTDVTLRAQIPERCDRLTLPIWVDHNKFQQSFGKRKGSMELLSGDAKILGLERSSHQHIYKIHAFDEILLKENTLYFPGWVAWDNGKFIAIDYNYQKFPGLIILKLPKGTHILTLKFVDTEIEQKAKILSLSALLFLVFIFTYSRFRVRSL